MSRSGVNKAVTCDGAMYNKLTRPDDFPSILPAASPEDGNSTPKPLAESTKRKLSDIDTDDLAIGENRQNKRSKYNGTSNKTNRSEDLIIGQRKVSNIRRPMNMTFGMQHQFPGLDDDEEVSDESTKNAFAYLRSVRSEASAIPKLLVAPTPEVPDGEFNESIYNDGRGDMRAFYKDGAYIARTIGPTLNTSRKYISDSSSEPDPQDAYYGQLLRRYTALRETIAKASPADLIERMNTHPSQCTDTKPPLTRREWLHTLDREFPTPAQVYQLDDRHTFRGLRYCMESLDRFEYITKQKSCWIWTLLAKAGEAGILDHTKIGSIRELGLKARELSDKFRRRTEEDNAAQPESDFGNEEDIVDWEVEDGEGVESDDSMSTSEGGQDRDVPEEYDTLEQARARLLAQLGDRLIEPLTVSELQEYSPERGCTRQPHRNGRRRNTSSLSSLSASPSPGRKPRHNGRCINIASPHSPSPPRKPLLSRAEAEYQRQKIRENELNVPKAEGLKGAISPTGRVEEKHQTRSTLVTGASDSPSRQRLLSGAEADYERRQLQGRNLELQKEISIIIKDEKVDMEVEEKADVEVEDAYIPDLNTRVTIDMILTVVAECYGQKDLLRFREIWGV